MGMWPVARPQQPQDKHDRPVGARGRAVCIHRLMAMRLRSQSEAARCPNYREAV